MGQRKRSDFLAHFDIIQDPRLDRRKLHRLETILFMALCAVICGVKSWVEMEEFGKARKEWFSKYVDLSNGVPSHDTFARVFAQLNPKEFEKVFLDWIQSVYQRTDGEVISIDGKSLRRAHDRKQGLGPLHLMQAWAQTNHLVLGQVKTQGVGTEIEAIPKLLEILDVKRCIVTIDAIGCQKEIAKQIQDKDGDYVLALKGNQGLLHEEVRQYWGDPELPANEYDAYETVEKGHGRIETRRYRMSDQIGWLQVRKDWKGLRSIGMVESERIVGDRTTVQRRYYLTSLKAGAKQLAKAIRAHWEIENKVHWCLDVMFQEDHSRARIKHAAQNLALLRRLSLNILRRDRDSKKSLNIRSRLASWKPEYLESLLNEN